MQAFNSSDNTLEPLFSACKDISAFLSGKLIVDAEQTVKQSLLLNGQQQDLQSISYLYDSLMLAQPQAGQAYWITRTWDLLCWQPLAIALVAVYQCHKSPSFCGFTQQVIPHMVSGFTLTSTTLETGAAESLIAKTGQQISVLFEHYQQCLNEVVRCRPRFSKRLLADNVMVRLVRLQKKHTQFTTPMIIEHAHWWFQALGLPICLIDSFYVQQDKSIELKRSSCCLAYKIPTGKFCANCPKNRSR